MMMLPFLTTGPVADQRPAFESKEIDRKVAALVKQMTLDEKVGQLVQFPNGYTTGPRGVHVDQPALTSTGRMGSILGATGAKLINEFQHLAVDKSRLKIPLIFGHDIIHGYRTIFPIPLGLSASWDTDLVQRTARVAAVEATSEGVRWTFSPMVDISRDARWGRVMEGAGEDPYLGSLISAAYVHGYQGKDLTDPTSMVACAKHYAGYGASEAGRDYNSVDISERMLRDVYLPPFKAAVDAGVGTLMSSFSSVQGVPPTASHLLLTEILRGEWGFQGFVVSDWNSVGELIEHGVALDNADAAFKSITAGLDMDMTSNAFSAELAGMVDSGRLKVGVLDEAVRRVLRIKFALGLFEQPFTDEDRAQTSILTPEHLMVAREAAEKSFVLFKNEAVAGKPVLPIQAGAKVALIGPLADSADDMLGGWAALGQGKDVITLKTALAERLGDHLIYAHGTEVHSSSDAGFAEALRAAAAADVVVMALGEDRNMSGEAHSRTTIGIPGNQTALLQAVIATGKPVVLVLFNGRPLTLNWEMGHVPAILEAWFPGVQAGPALARTLFGDVSPSGRLTMSFPRAVGQLPLYYNHFNTGRPTNQDTPTNDYLTGYNDERNSPLLPFGWGLTYTTFEYAAPQIVTKSVRAADLNKGAAVVEVTGTVTNRGERPGIETVQLYIGLRGTSVVRPVRELKGFERVQLAPGASKAVSFRLTGKDLAFYNLEMKHAIEPCELTVWIGPHAQGGQSAKIRIEP